VLAECQLYHLTTTSDFLIDIRLIYVSPLNPSAFSTAVRNNSMKHLLFGLVVFLQTSGLANADEVEKTSHWTLSRSMPVFSDSERFVLETTALETAECRFGRKPAKLVFACHEGKASARFETHCRISTDDLSDDGLVTYRVDRRDVLTRRFSESDDNRALGLWTTTDSRAFIETLKGGAQLAARIKPQTYAPFVATFDLTGFDEAIQPLMDACEPQSLSN
jgi:hypothetical protein